MAEKKDIMELIRESNKSVVSGIDEKDIKHWVTIYIMGKAYRVPAGLTLMQAMEYAGYRFIRSCGCRAGFCGACATIYRKADDYRLHGVLACQTQVEDGMYLVQIPFAPAEKPTYDINELAYDVSSVVSIYPEATRCVSCNTCTKACPQDLKVMDYVQDAIKGDFERAARESFDCIQCGLCAVRCPAEIVQYHLAQLVRRLYGKYGMPPEKNLKKRIKELDQGKFDEEFEKVMNMPLEELKKLYREYQENREVY